MKEWKHDWYSCVIGSSVVGVARLFWILSRNYSVEWLTFVTFAQICAGGLGCLVLWKLVRFVRSGVAGGRA